MKTYSVRVILLVVLSAACGKGGGDKVARETVEKDIRSVYESMEPTSVTCPDGVKKKEGGTFECTLDVADGNKFVIGVGMGNRFRYEIKSVTTKDGKTYSAKEYQDMLAGAKAAPDTGDDAPDDSLEEATVEARVMLKTLYKGAFEYYADTKESDEEAQFPGPSQGPIPPLGTCCKNPDKACQPDESLWTSPPWVLLQFSIDDPHYYSYSYESDGQSFTARAYGDLDCDGQYSTFELSGGADGPREVEPTATHPLE